jgi:hypothetical protein
MSRWFSDRHGYGGSAPEITIREDATPDLRYAVAHIARMVGMRPKAIRAVVCEVLFVAPDPGNWSDFPNIWEEVQALLRECEWFKVYDVAEALWRRLDDFPDDQLRFQDELNRFFREKGIGWELKDAGGIVFRGGEPFAAATTEAAETLEQTGRATAADELREAMRDISRRPKPDVTGAIRHAMAALECTARDICGERNKTLGDLIPQLDLPKPLNEAVTKLWGYSSERARHRREGENVADDEAELVVSVACAVCTFLAKRHDR